MAIPKKIHDMRAGVPGSVAYVGPYRAQVLTVETDTPSNAMFGRAYTKDVDNSGVAKPGLEGGGEFAGLAVSHLALANENGLLEPGRPGEFMTMGTAWVRVKIGKTWVPADGGGA